MLDAMADADEAATSEPAAEPPPAVRKPPAGRPVTELPFRRWHGGRAARQPVRPHAGVPVIEPPSTESTLVLNSVETDVDTLGPGPACCIWVQGCGIGCASCTSPHTWDASAGAVAEVRDVAQWLLSTELHHLTISGGEPFDQAPALVDLVDIIRAVRDWVVTCYSGYPRSAPGARDVPRFDRPPPPSRPPRRRALHPCEARPPALARSRRTSASTSSQAAGPATGQGRRRRRRDPALGPVLLRRRPARPRVPRAHRRQPPVRHRAHRGSRRHVLLSLPRVLHPKGVLMSRSAVYGTMQLSPEEQASAKPSASSPASVTRCAPHSSGP